MDVRIDFSSSSSSGPARPPGFRSGTRGGRAARTSRTSRGTSSRRTRRTASHEAPKSSPTHRSSSGRATAARCSSSSRRWTPPARTRRSSTSCPASTRRASTWSPSRSRRRRSSTTTSSGARRRRCPSAAASASSTGRTTRRSSRSGSTRSGSNRSAFHPAPRDEGFWQQRYEDINAFERHLDRNGTKIVKFFLHVSKAVQKERFLARLDTPGKEWKFNAADVDERARWDDYMNAFEAALTATSTPWAPWYVVPADHKLLTQAVVAQVLVGDGQVARSPLAERLGGPAHRQRGGAQEARGRDVVTIEPEHPGVRPGSYAPYRDGRACGGIHLRDARGALHGHRWGQGLSRRPGTDRRIRRADDAGALARARVRPHRRAKRLSRAPRPCRGAAAHRTPRGRDGRGGPAAGRAATARPPSA